MPRVRPLAPLLLVALSATGCGAAGTSSTGSFKGVQGDVAQTVSDLSKAGSKGDERQICDDLLARALVRRLDAGPGCAKAVGPQLDAADSFDLPVKAVHVTGATATAVVESKQSGHTRRSTLTLVREGGRWRISGVR